MREHECFLEEDIEEYSREAKALLNRNKISDIKPLSVKRIDRV